MTKPYGEALFSQHAELLRASAIAPEVAAERGYVSVDTKTRLEGLKFTKSQRQVPGLLIPIWATDGEIRLHQHRPDTPRLNGDGKPIKYETPFRSQIVIDVPPRAREHLGETSVPLWITEGARKADAAVTAGLCCVALIGVNGWTRDRQALPDWRHILLKNRLVYVAFDSDVMVKREVKRALRELSGFLDYCGAHVQLVYLPHGDDDTKVGLDDYLAAGHSIDELVALAREPVDKTPQAEPLPQPEPEPATPVSLHVAVKTFRQWLHLDDTAPVLAVAAAIVANRAAGDPVWLLVVGPPSGGKTEIISSAAGLSYIVKAATVTEAALLSGTASRERAANATGGLLRMIGDFGILLSKDFTSVLSQNRDTAKAAMAALREVFDGSWDRPVGTDGGRVLSWSGKCGLIGGVTPSFDRYSVITSSLGDRFLLLRLPDVSAAKQAASALRRRDHDAQMRTELAAAMTGLVHGANLDHIGRDLHDHEHDRLIALATYTARARTAVERDGYTKELVVIPQAEGPARLVLGLRHLYGGLEAIGVDEPTRWAVVARIARDCVPAIRNKLVLNLIGRTRAARTSEVAAAVGMVTKTAHQHLEDLALLGLADRTKTSEKGNAPDMWAASDWLREFWPDSQSENEMYVRTGNGFKEGLDADSYSTTTHATADTPLRTSRSHFDGLDGTRPCGVCSRSFIPNPPSRAVCDRCIPHLAGTQGAAAQGGTPQ